jgi:hypothetical protein
MKHRPLVILSTLGLSLTLLGARAHAKAAKAEQGWPEDSEVEPKDTKKDSTKDSTSEEKGGAQPASAAGADEADEPAAKASKEDAPPPAVDVADEQASRISNEPPPERPPVYGARRSWAITPYGYARFDAMEDSTQSFEDGIQPNLIQRAGTYRGDHRRTIFTARDSRLGMHVAAPQYQSIRSMGQIELDFYGLVPTDARRHDSVVFGPLRIRLAFLKLETPIIDVVAGQYYDLFGWNGSFYVGTVGYLGVPAEVYHRNPQLRLEKKLHFGQLDVTLAAAAVRPGQRDSGLPEGQFGLKLAYHGWASATMPGFGRPTLSPLSLGVSGLYRTFEVPVFRAEPGSESTTTFGWGFAVQALVPIIPVHNLLDRGNSLTLIGEYTRGAGIADMYTFMDGGSRFPILPNPSMAQPAVIYQANVDPGLVTFDRNFDVKPIDWQAVVANLQYFLPIDRGRVWVEGTYSRIWSDNIKDLTPFPSWGGIFTKMEYFDANLGFDITPAVALGLSFQRVKQTFGDVSADTPIYGMVPNLGAAPGGVTLIGTGGVAASAFNDRFQLSMAFYF